MSTKSKVTIFTIVQLVSMVVCSETLNVKNNASGPVTPFSFLNLGTTADGITYIAEVERTFSLEQSRVWCAMHGFLLASLRDQNQLNLVRDGLIRAGLSGQWFWTSAEIRPLQASSFQWAPTVPIDNALDSLQWTIMTGDSQYCVAFASYNATSTRLHVTHCSLTNIFPLCQLQST